MSDAKLLVDKLWAYCNILRDDGLSYGEYVEQLTYLLFLKMADEQRTAGGRRIVPKGLDWQSLLSLSGESLHAHYVLVLSELGRGEDMLGVIFAKARNRIQDPAKLERLIKDLIDSEQWISLDSDVKGDAYEGLLERNAADVKSGAGQYFTPRPLIAAIIEVVKPKPGMMICDPACGTGGFFLGVDRYLQARARKGRDADSPIPRATYTGWEIVPDTARLCAMNLVLHGLENPDSKSPIHVGDALREDPGRKFDVILTNPPFGRRSVVTIVNGGSTDGSDLPALAIARPDFWVSTSNKQLNFLQHVAATLADGGRAAVVVPDNVLFEGGPGEVVRRRLLDDFDVHTLLRLPTGIFYAHGVKASVMFFDKVRPRRGPATKGVWIYDLRTNLHFTLKTKPLTPADLADFVSSATVNVNRRKESERFRWFDYDTVTTRDKASLDITWLEEGSAGDEELPPTESLLLELIEELEASVLQLQELVDDLPAGVGTMAISPPDQVLPTPRSVPRRGEPRRRSSGSRTAQAGSTQERRATTPRTKRAATNEFDLPAPDAAGLNDRILSAARSSKGIRVEDLRRKMNTDPLSLQKALAALLRDSKVREVRGRDGIRIFAP